MAINLTLIYLTRKRSGDVARRSVEFQDDIIRIGRGADCHVHLPDPRLPLFHSKIAERLGNLFIEATDRSPDLEVNRVWTSSAQLQAKDRINVGPYEIVVETAAANHLALTVELIRPLGDDFAQLIARSRTSLQLPGLGTRGWSWVLFGTAILLALIVPLFTALNRTGEGPASQLEQARPRMSETVWSWASPMSWLSTADSLWISGDVSSPHRYFAADCARCHQKPFVQVLDAACLSCHVSARHHADPQAFRTASFEGMKCAHCHKEHNGIQPIVLDDQAFCISCHADLDQQEPKTMLHNVTDFGISHPEFRPSVITDAASPTRVRMTIGSQPKPTENSNLKFPHLKHLGKGGVSHPEKGKIQLACGDCHRLEPGGLGMLPIRMVDHCHDCHQLQFEPTAPQRRLPHGKPREAIEQMREFYARMALFGGVADPKAPDSVRRRRRPGTELSRDESAASLDWALAKAAEVATETIGKRACGVCHFIKPPGAKEKGIWDVAPVKLADRWMLKGRFDHAKHEQMTCVDCHAAPGSATAHDVLLPGIKTCQHCHGGEEAADRVPSTCIVCHDFHMAGQPPMRGAIHK